MIDDPKGDEKTEFLTKTERVTVSQQGIIVDLHSVTGNGKKMALIIPGKIAFLIRGIMGQEDVLGGIRVLQEAPQVGFTTIVTLEVVGIQIVE